MKHEGPTHIQRSPVSASYLERRDPFPAWSGKNSWRSRRISRGSALHRKGQRNSRVVPPFPESPRCLTQVLWLSFVRRTLQGSARERWIRLRSTEAEPGGSGGAAGVARPPCPGPSGTHEPRQGHVASPTKGSLAEGHGGSCRLSSVSRTRPGPLAEDM